MNPSLLVKPFVVDVATSSNLDTDRNRLAALHSQLSSHFTVLLVLVEMPLAHVFFPGGSEFHPGHCLQLV